MQMEDTVRRLKISALKRAFARKRGQEKNTDSQTGPRRGQVKKKKSEDLIPVYRKGRRR